MNPLPVNAKNLRRRAAQFSDAQLPNVSLLPCYDESGAVRQLLIVTDDGRRVAMLEWRDGLVRVPWSGPMIIDEPTGVLRPLSSYQASQAAKLWHFDPDWLLRKPGCASGTDCRSIMAMNCDGRWTGKVGGLFFRRDLSRISLVGVKQSGGGYSLVGWRAKYLPSGPAPTVAQLAAPAARPSPGRTVWVLDPIWQR